jgi:hypothetical protein
MGAFNQDGVDMDKLKEKAVDIVLAGLKGIKNCTVDGVVKDIDKIDESVLELFDFEVIAELMSKVMEFNFLSRQEEKN